VADAKEAARDRVEQARDELVALSHRIHANPELGFEEEQACAWLCELLDRGGLEVERGVGELPTAFAARAGSGPLHVVVCAEYDALPGVGHACGHNVIAAMAAGAGLALARVADDAGLKVTVLGTPAEEGGGGKILLLQRGAFDGAHLAMMVHPSPYEQAEMPIIASDHLKVAYTGKEAHASAYPFLGVNAADAMVIAQTAIGLLRQQLRASDRVHGIVTRGRGRRQHHPRSHGR
jgi:amidohydrolase